MKQSQQSKTLLALIASAALFAANAALAADYKIDASHSSVGFGIRHLVGKVKGQFKEFEGTFSFDAKKPAAATGKFVVKTASISTENEKRDEHLKNEDFFDVKKHPEMTLDKIKLAPKGKDKYKMTGELALHGVTKPVTFDLAYNGSAKDPWGNTRAGFTATGKINRKDFGISWNKALDAGGVMLGEDVEIELQIEAIENAPAADDKAKQAVKEESKKSE
jgi:polyisoprenoid-binding protein YceI